MLGLVSISSRSSRPSEDHIQFSFSSYKYELQTIHTSSTLLDESSAEKVQKLLNKINNKIGKERKGLRKLSLLVYFIFVLLFVLVGIQIVNLEGKDSFYSGSSSTVKNSKYNKTSFTIVLSFMLLLGILYLFWSKYKIGKKIFNKTSPVIERNKDNMKNLGLTLSIQSNSYFPLIIDILPISPFTPNESERTQIQSQVLYPGQTPEIEILVHGKTQKKQIKEIITDEREGMYGDFEVIGSPEGPESIFLSSPMTNLETPHFNNQKITFK